MGGPQTTWSITGRRTTLFRSLTTSTFQGENQEDENLTIVWKLSRFKLELFETTYCNTVTNTGEYSCLKVYFKNIFFLLVDHNWMTLSLLSVKNPFPTMAPPPCFQILMVFKREFSYYLLTIYVPSCMLVIVSWVSPFLKFCPNLYLKKKSGNGMYRYIFLQVWLKSIWAVSLTRLIVVGLLLVGQPVSASQSCPWGDHPAHHVHPSKITISALLTVVIIWLVSLQNAKVQHPDINQELLSETPRQK